jgi:hypothetical protein
MTVKLSARLALSGASFLLLSTASASHAATNYVLNGSFETNSGHLEKSQPSLHLSEHRVDLADQT